MRALSIVSIALCLSCASATDEAPDNDSVPALDVCGPGEAGPCSCGASGEVCAEDQWCDGLAGACSALLADKCTPGTEWAPGVRIFRDATEEWGLAELQVEGQRISVGDIDGDGFADLAVRRAGGGSDDFSPGGRRVTWLLRNTGEGGFEDVTESSGFVTPRDSSSSVGRPLEVVVFGDVTNDGALDAFTGWHGSDESDETSEILFNDGTGRFSLGPASNPLRREGERSNIAGASFVDVDRDGLLDLWLGQGAVDGAPRQDALFRGIGTGEFFDQTLRHGLSTRPRGDPDEMNQALAHSNAWGVTACDLDGDGIPELLAASYGRAPNHLWLGGLADDGWVEYRNHSIASGYAFDHRVDWTDNESARCWCMHNGEAEGCDGVPPPSWIRCQSAEDAFRWRHHTDREPHRLGGNSATTVCADITGTGRLDLLTTEIVHWDVGESSDPTEILVNTGETPLRFERPGPQATGLDRPRVVPWDHGDMTAAVFDADNSGRMDVLIGSADYPGTRAWLFVQRRDGSFVPVPFDLGVDHTSSHGAAVADLSRDGALDLVLGHSRMRCSSGDHCYETAGTRLFENVLAGEGNWIQLDLVGGEGTNRSAIGAHVTVDLGDRVQLQEVGGGHGHYGAQNDSVLHFGLGPECEAEVTIRWPDEELSEQRVTLRTGYRYRIIQGELPTVVPAGAAAD